MDYTTLASKESVERTAKALESHGFKPTVIGSGKEAFETIKKLIPRGASVMNGSSRTLEEIGFVEYLKAGQHGWNNLHAAIVAETDKDKQRLLRRQALISDYYLGSVHALSETGEFVIASNTGSQLPHVVFTSPNLIFVVGTQKIVPTLADALARVNDYVYPLEDTRMKEVGYGGSSLNKTLIFHRENPKMGRKVTMILVEEKLGF